MCLSTTGEVPNRLQRDTGDVRRRRRRAQQDGGDSIGTAEFDEGVLVDGIPGAEVPDEAEGGEEGGRGVGGNAAERRGEGSGGGEVGASPGGFRSF